MTSLILSVVISWMLLDYKSNDFMNLQFGAWRNSFTGTIERIVFVLIAMVALRHFLFLFYHVDGEYRSLHPFNLGDLPLHIHYIRNLAAGVEFPPRNPNFSTENLRYPFGIDLYNALWECLGTVTSGHLFLVGFFSSIAALMSLRLAGSWVAMVAFFFSGGYLAIANGGSQAVQNALSWKNLFLAMFITQRGFLFALPSGVLIIYYLLLNARRKPEIKLHPRTLMILGILWGSLAFFHLHSFFILSLMIFISAAYWALSDKLSLPQIIQNLKRISMLWIMPLVIGSYFVLISLNQFKTASVLHWRLGWTIEPGQNILSYLTINFGSYLLLVLGIGYYLLQHRLRNLYFEFVMNLSLFILFFNFMLAPWSWDNIKILVWPYLALLFLAYEVLRRDWENWVQIVLLVSLSYGGVYALSASQFSVAEHVGIYTNSELANARGATQGLPVNAVFASSTTYNHELTALGRNRAMGYEGHLWGHGISFASTKQKLLVLMTGEEHWLEAAHELKVNYIYWGPKEKLEFSSGTKIPKAWLVQLRNVSRVKDYEVYEIP